MPLEEFLLVTAREKIKDFILKYLTDLGHESSIDDITNVMAEKAEYDPVADKRFRTIPAERAILRREVVNIVRKLAHMKKVVMVSDDRFCLPGQQPKYRTLDDFWES